MNKSLQIHQFSPDISYGDAASNHLFDTTKALKNAGYISKIFCERSEPVDFGYPIHSIGSYENEASVDSILLIHFTLCYSEQMMARLKQLPSKKILVYHNITPHVHFYGVNNSLYETAKNGRRQLRQLASFIDTAFGVSEFNCEELRTSGWQSVHRVPISFDTERYQTEPDENVLQWGSDNVNILFVGRIAPNKKFEDLLLTFYFVKKLVQPDAKLVLIGANDSSMQPYGDYLQTLIERLQLEDVHITGHISTAELVAYYKTASVYLSMSEHEGFGVPLLESIYFDVPILAYKSSAIPETLNGQGILFTEKRHQSIAELIGLIINDNELRERIVQNQRSTLEKFSYTAFQEQLLTIISTIQQ